MGTTPARRRRARRALALTAGVAIAAMLATTASTAAASNGHTPAARPGTLAALPDGLNIAVNAKVTANSGAAPGSTLANAVDGDGTTRWCPSVVGTHTLTVDLGRVTDLTGAGVTFSGEEGSDGSHYTVSTGVSRPDQTPFPNQAAGNRNGIVQGPLYLFAGSNADVAGTVKARYVTLTYLVPREQDICVQEFRVFSDDARSAPALQLGGDLTNLVSDNGRTWTGPGGQASMLDLVKTGGMNYGGIQLLVNPTNCAPTCADLANALAVAKQLKAAGLKITLELDYSDAPTSSTAQSMPAAWVGQDQRQLTRTVHDYTESTIKAFAHNGTPVAQVSIGHAITQGLLWPAGQLTFDAARHADWSNLTDLLRAGTQGARDGNPHGNALRVQLDLDSAADNTTSVDFLRHLSSAHVGFDVIGESYSPWQQGSLSALKANLLDLISRFGKPIVLSGGQFPYANVTGYGNYSTTVPYPDTLPGYLISPSGQASYERDLVSLLASLPGHDGLGVYYSAPDTTGALGLFSAAGVGEPGLDSYRIGSDATLYSGRSLTAPGERLASVTNLAAPAATALAVTVATGAAAAAGPDASDPAQPGTLPPLPAGLDVAIGDKVTANTGSAPGSALSNVDDGDGTSYWCPGSLGDNSVTVDLGHVTDLTGTGVTFSGEQTGDGSSYTISTGVSKPNQTPFPNQVTGQHNGITQGALYLFAGSSANVSATVRARYVTLTYRVPREQNICVQELRLFSANAPAASRLELGADLSTLISDTATYTLNGTAEPILSIFQTGGLNYVRLRLWLDPATGDCSAHNCPDLTNDLKMASMAKAAGMRVLLDFHYSDTWADPQHQNVPSPWAGQTMAQLTGTIHDYTQSVVAAFAANGTPVDQVAIGNEITQGTLWAATSVLGGASTLAAGSSTLSASSAAGATTIAVARSTNFAAGQTVTIDSAANAETAVIAAVTGNTLTLTAGLARAHAVGVPAATLLAAGASTIQVASVANFSAGQTVAIDAAAGQETAVVASVGTAGVTGTGLTLTAPLTRPHSGAVSVATATPAGTSTLKVASTAGMTAGDTVFVDAGTNLVPNQLTETDTIASVGTPGPAGTGITLRTPLTLPHLGAVTVQDVQTSGKLLFDPKTGKADWTSLTSLLKGAAQGAKAANPAGHQMLIQLHVDRGGDNATTVDWINHMITAGVPFDVIGESYYPWYHGSMAAMRANLTELVNRYHKYVMIAEDQFPQAPQGGYGTFNAADANYPDTLPGYLVTPAGQASYQRDLNSIIAALPDGKGLGVFYWSGDTQGNLGMFNQQHVAQPIIFANQVQ